MRKPSLLSPRTSSRTASTAGSSIQASAVQTASPHPSQYDIHYQLSELSELDIFAASFLNPDDNFIRAQLESAKIEVSITEAVSSLVGSISDIQTIAVEFNQNIYTWMPILSHQQFQETLLERLTLRRAELFLLVLAMKLCVSRPTVARSALYTTVKEFYISVESSGRLSILILQAAVLIAVYELGHGIYPAVLLSVANCARIGVLLGVDNSLTKLAHTTEIPWIKLEECRRVWWMILILDRFVNLSNPKRHLVTSDPDSDSYLPVDDAEWDSGISKPADAVQLRFSSQMNIGRFARFAHAVPLLSQCISRVDEAPHDTVQLRRTILSLINLGEKEGVTKRILFCTLNAACYM
ncbi:hypothetical protein TrVFT333_004580 [Trichoderma virens FT-333]|nr:hypothetical protein TrVFT333_004580 [Trichoderma virens FT-333]